MLPIGILPKGLLSYFLIQPRNLLHRGGTVLSELGPPHQLLIKKTPYRLVCEQPDGAFSQTRLHLPRPGQAKKEHPAQILYHSVGT